MKTTKTKIAVALLSVLLTLTNISCKKEPGPKGDKGETGAAGANGNANVKTKKVTINNWTYLSPSYKGNALIPEITQDILDNGAVLVYMETSANDYSQLPVTIYPSASYSETFETIHSMGQVVIFISDSDLTQPSTPGTYKFKIVIIDGEAMRKQNINPKDKAAIQKAFNL